LSRLGYRLAEILNAVPQGGGEYAARCPVCGDSKQNSNKRRFLINVEHDKFCCFNGGCTAKGNRNELIELLKKLDGGIKAEFLLDSGSRIIYSEEQEPSLPIKKEISEISLKLIKRSLPYTRLPPIIKKSILNDLLPRKVFTYDEIAQLRVVPQLVHYNWDWRVIIPVTAEIFQGKSTQGKKPKYLSPPGLDWFFADDIPNAAQCDEDKPVIISEGILDYHSLPVGNRSLSGGDKRFYSSEMINYISRFNDVILSLDSDFAGFCVATELYQVRSKLKNVRVFYPHLIDEGKKDLNDLLIHNVQSKEELRDLVLRNTISLNEAYLHVVSKKIRYNGGRFFGSDMPKWSLREMEL